MLLIFKYFDRYKTLMKSVGLAGMFLVMNHTLCQTTATVYTPNNTAVTVLVLTEFTQSQINAINALAATEWPNASILSDASAKYNCHAYAWYLTECVSCVKYWMNTPGEDNYWQDCSYLEVTSSEAMKISYSNDDHSAIKSVVSGKYDSKWGQYPVMRHSPAYTPYVSTGLKYYAKPTISGPTSICSSGSTFSVTGIPQGASIAWSSSSNISRDSSQGSNPCTFSKTGTGSTGWVKATISNTGCGGNVIIQKNIWVGTPSIGYDINEDFTMCRDLSSTSNNNFPVNIQGMDATTTWEVQKITNNHDVSMQGNEVLVTLQYAAPYNYIAFKVRASNSCGFSNWLEYYVEVIDYCGSESYNSFIVYPNPSSEIIYVRAKWSKEVIHENIPFQVYDFNGPLIEEGNLFSRSAIDVSNYKKGMYILRIDKGVKPETHQLIIE